MIAPVILVLLAFRPNYSHTVTGIITDSRGGPLQGVAVRAKGSSVATVSATDGNYK